MSPKNTHHKYTHTKIHIHLYFLVTEVVTSVRPLAFVCVSDEFVFLTFCARTFVRGYMSVLVMWQFVWGILFYEYLSSSKRKHWSSERRKLPLSINWHETRWTCTYSISCTYCTCHMWGFQETRRLVTS